ncbi:MAG: hypothetical protein JSR91_24045 [Proteobacteria bacterium]|nr:hypothetical protein [Pseudomonadota bacterium]
MALIYLPLHRLLSVLNATSLLVHVAIAFIAFGGFYCLWLDALVPEAHGSFADQIYRALSDPRGSLLYLLPFVAIPVGLLFHFLVLHARPLQPFDAKDYFIYYTWIAAWAAFGVSLAVLGLASSLQIGKADWRHDVLEWSVSAAFASPVFGLIAGFARLGNKDAAIAASLLVWIAPAMLLFSLAVIVIPS